MRFKRWMGVLGIVAMAATTAACGGGDSTASGSNGLEKAAIKVGVLPLGDYAAVYWADEKGYFEDQGLDVTLEPLQGGPIGVQKVASGELDFSFSNTVSSTIAVDKGAPIKTVALTSSLGSGTQMIFVKPDSPIQGIEDLDGKSIGVNTVNNIGDVTFKNLANSEGVDVEPDWVEVPFPEMLAGVQNGSVDAGYFAEPFATAAKAAGLRPVVDLTQGPNKSLPAATFVTSSRFAAANPKTVAAFQRAIAVASEDIAAKQDEFRTWLPTISQTPAAAAAIMGLPVFETQVTVEKMQRVADILAGLGLVGDKYDASDATLVSGS
jgi:NitT/TauT family transport system substrate-binding protein